MPLAQITLIEGRDDEQKKNLISEVTQAISRSIGAPEQSVRIIINEVPATQWGIGGKTAKDLGR